MNLVEELLKIDSGEFSRTKTRTMTSRVLSDLMGEETKITLQSVNPQEIMQLSAIGTDEEGNTDMSKALEANSLIAAAVVVDPPLKDEKLQKHLGVATPADAALKLFGGEVNKIAEKAGYMAGFNDNANGLDKEIKN